MTCPVCGDRKWVWASAPVALSRTAVPARCPRCELGIPALEFHAPKRVIA